MQCLGLLGLLIWGCLGAFSQPIVSIEQGDILGETVTFIEDEFINVDKEINIFRGIPFAEPPLGNLRFMPTVKKTNWDGVWNATYDRPVCHQQDDPWTIMFEKNEDCLFLSVYAPNPMPTNATVLVWIHGGGYSLGSGSQYEYIGTPLVATGDVIVVNINYRLGAFGFLTTGDNASPGSYGMLDQVEALKWVQTNIHAFGGDPNKVTIFGESSGASSVDLHLYSPLSADLFQRAIIQSGSAQQLFTTNTDEARDAAFQLGETLGCTANDNAQLLIDCIREIPAEELFQASNANSLLGNPCVDGSFMVDTPLNLLEKQQFKRTSLLMGNNADEATFFLASILPVPNAPQMTREQYETLVGNQLSNSGYDSEIIIEGVNQVYIDWALADNPDLDYFPTYITVLSDKGFICNMDLVARAHVSAGDTVYQYHYTHITSVKTSPDWTGASHTEELQYVFGLPFNPILTKFHDVTDDEKRLSVNVMKYWTNFAKTGNPNMESDDELFWPIYTIPELNYKELKVNLTTGSRGLKAAECHFWNEHLPQLGTFVGDLNHVEQEWREEFYTWKYDDMENWRDEFDKYKEDTQ